MPPFKEKLSDGDMDAVIAYFQSKWPEDVYQTQFGKNYGYLSEDGRYLLVGNLIDLQTGQNMTNIAKPQSAKILIARFAITDKAVFPATVTVKAVLNIFTDTSCPYCRKLHEEVA